MPPDSKVVAGDAGAPDSSSPLARGTWISLTAYSACPPSIAADPAVAIPPLTWAECSPSRVGCRKLLVDWTDRTDIGPIRSAGYPAVRVARSKTFFSYTQLWPEWVMGVVRDGLDGPAIFASAHSPYEPVNCSAAASVGPKGISLLGFVGGSARPKEIDSKVILGFASWDRPTEFKQRLADVSEFGVTTASGSVNDIVASERTSFAVSNYPFSIHPVDPIAMTVSRGFNTAGMPVVPVPDGALAAHPTTLSLLLVRDDGSTTVFATPEVMDATKRVISFFDFDQSRRDAVAWVECNADELGTGSVLWSAAYSTDPTKVVRRRVGRLPEATPSGARGFVFHDGEVLVTIGKTTAAIYRVADGTGWQLQADPGTEFSEPVWLDANEAVLQTRRAGERPSGLLRLRRDGLGAATLSLL